MVNARVGMRFFLSPIRDPSLGIDYLSERPTGPLLLELLRARAEIQALGRSRYSGSLAERNALWRDDRNFLRQGISNFRVALEVDNRSASLLYYYAMLNFAKSELLAVNPRAVQGPVHHGLQFRQTPHQTVRGDSLTVKSGVFRILYEHRTGVTLPIGTRLPVPRLLRRIPEISSQLDDLGWARSEIDGALQMIASGINSTWAVLAVSRVGELEANSSSGKLFRRFFHRVEPPADWRARFGMSNRVAIEAFYESPAFAFTPGDSASEQAAGVQAQAHAWKIRELLGHTTSGMWDAWVSPSLYKSKMVPMPPALARYAIAFYGSSLVRYRPSMFDAQLHPDFAYLFDSISHESAVPMLIDTLAGISGRHQVFFSEEAMRH
jgi:hypothetical protein